MSRPFRFETFLFLAVAFLIPCRALARAPKGWTQVALSAGVVTPYDGLHQGGTLGWTAGFCFEYMATNTIGVGGNANYTRFATTSHMFKRDPLDQQLFEQKTTDKLIDFGIQVKLYLVRWAGLSPFLEAGLNACVVRSAVSIEGPPQLYDALAGNLRLGVGSDLELTQRMDAVASVSRHLVKYLDSSESSSYWGMRLGLAYQFH